MGGCRCSYKCCLRATKNSDKGFHFFHYPAKDRMRCVKWIQNANKPEFLHLSDDQLRNKVICQLHFLDEYFTNRTKRRLIHTAIPTLDAGSDLEVKQNSPLNVQVLQSDSAGNVFMVDTKDITTEQENNVTSYVIQDGNLVPLQLLPDGTISKPAGYNSYPSSSSVEETIIPDTPESPLKNEIQQEEKSIYLSEPISNNVIYIEEAELTLSDSENSKVFIKPPSSPRPISPDIIQTNNKSSVLEVPELYHINTNIQDDVNKTIERHTIEIARLQRLLKCKIKPPKRPRPKRLNPSVILQSLNGMIPATLHGALSLHLHNKKSNFNDNERKFIMTVYRQSPAAYELLLKKCRWKLPCEDIAEKMIFNCI